MKPIGLTMKKGRHKYQREPRGELMLIHECVECKALSINRIAADDDSATVMTVFQESFRLSPELRTQCQQQGIVLLNANNIEMVCTQLYGRSVEIPAMCWT